MRNIPIKILLLFHWFSPKELEAQIQLGMNGKISTKQNYGFDFKIGYQSLLFNIGFMYPINNGSYGERIQNVGWNQFPQDIYESGSYYDFMDLGIHYLIHKNILIGAKISLGTEYEYQNRYDRLQILGSSGYYHNIRYSGNEATNLGFDLDYVFNLKESAFSIISGISWSKQNSVGINLGCFFSL